MTSRTVEFTTAVRETGVITSAAAIVARPLTAMAAARYLTACALPGRAAAWEQVLAAPGGRGGEAPVSLVRVCQTPLGDHVNPETVSPSELGNYKIADRPSTR